MPDVVTFNDRDEILEVVQDEETILRDSQRLIETYHDPTDFAMTRLALAPCSSLSQLEHETGQWDLSNSGFV